MEGSSSRNCAHDHHGAPPTCLSYKAVHELRTRSFCGYHSSIKDEDIWILRLPSKKIGRGWAPGARGSSRLSVPLASYTVQEWRIARNTKWFSITHRNVYYNCGFLFVKDKSCSFPRAYFNGCPSKAGFSSYRPLKFHKAFAPVTFCCHQSHCPLLFLCEWFLHGTGHSCSW